MGEDFRGKKWDVTVQTQAEAGRNAGVARMDAKAAKVQEDRQLVLNALAKHGGSAGISMPTLKRHLPFAEETVCHVALRNRVEDCIENRQLLVELPGKSPSVTLLMNRAKMLW